MDITSPIEILRKITDSKNLGGEVQLWEGYQGHFSKTPMHLNQIKSDDDTLVFRPQKESLVILEELLKERSFLNIYLPQGSYLFKVRWKHHDRDGNLGTYFPDLLRFIERRNNDRLYPERYIKININSELKSCYDLSTDGLSIVYTKSEQCPHQLGDIIASTIEYDRLKIPIKLEVNTSTKIQPFIFENIPYGHKKIGFKIVDIAPKSLAVLEKLLKYHEDAFNE